MNAILYLFVIITSFVSTMIANTFTSDVHRRYGINSHIMHIPLYLKEQEDTQEKMAKKERERIERGKRDYVRKQLKHKPAVKKPVAKKAVAKKLVMKKPVPYKVEKKAKAVKAAPKAVKPKNHRKARKAIQENRITTSKHPLLRL